MLLRSVKVRFIKIKHPSLMLEKELQILGLI